MSQFSGNVVQSGGGGGGTVTAIGMTVPTGLDVTPASITTSGTFAITLHTGYIIPTTASLATYVVGPASATDSAVALFDGTTGKLIKNSSVTSTTLGTYVVGPGSATDSAVALFDGTTGKLIKNSSVTATTLGTYVVGPGSATANAIPTYSGTTGKIIQNNSTATIDSSGRMTNTAQPCFTALAPGTQTDLPINAITRIQFTETVDQGNNFASNVFTAPVTGNYFLSAWVTLDQVDSATAIYNMYVRTTQDSTNYFFAYAPANDQLADGRITLTWSGVVPMTATDTADVAIQIDNSGSAQADVVSQSGFSGFLVC